MKNPNVFFNTKYLVKCFILCVFFTCVLCSSCWNYREIDDIYIVAAAAIDINPENNNYILTVEVYDFEKSRASSGKTTEIFSAEGMTLFESLRNVIKYSGRRLYWGHAKVMIISSELAKQGIARACDWIIRDAEVRLDTYITISKEESARKILRAFEQTPSQQAAKEKQNGVGSSSNSNKSSSQGEEEVISMQIFDALKSHSSLGKTCSVKIHELIELLACECVEACLPTVSIQNIYGKPYTDVSGMALFKGEKLVGFLSPEESFYALFVKSKIKGGIFNSEIPMPQKPRTSLPLQNDFALEIFNEKASIKYDIKEDDKISFDIHVEVHTAIAEEARKIDYFDPKSLEKIVFASEQILNERIHSVILKVQKHFNTDIFGLARHIKNSNPSFWKKISRHWYDIFPETAVRVDSKIKIRNAGVTSKGIEVK